VAEVNLLRSLPQSKRGISARESAKTEEHIRISREYGKEYFDGSRNYGYGGYFYDGRWLPVAADIIGHFCLRPGDRVLDVGCAKGFLVNDLMLECPGLEAFGLDVSSYALMNCLPAVTGRLHLGSGVVLPFPDDSFDAVISLNTIHNFTREGAVAALKEIERVSRGKSFVQVDSYLNAEQKMLFESWVLTAKFHDFPEGWFDVFKEAGYKGDYYWTIVE